MTARANQNSRPEAEDSPLKVILAHLKNNLKKTPIASVADSARQSWNEDLLWRRLELDIQFLSHAHQYIEEEDSERKRAVMEKKGKAKEMVQIVRKAYEYAQARGARTSFSNRADTDTEEEILALEMQSGGEDSDGSDTRI